MRLQVEVNPAEIRCVSIRFSLLVVLHSLVVLVLWFRFPLTVLH